MRVTIGVGAVLFASVSGAQVCEYPIVDLAKCPNRTARASHQPAINGCGPEGSGLKLPQGSGLADFTSACNVHDVCYETCNADKATCDKDLAESARQSCLKAYPHQSDRSVDEDWDSRGTCLSRARLYGSAVSKLGRDAYAAAQKVACECCRRYVVTVHLAERSQLIAPFVNAQVSDEGFTFNLPSPISDGSYSVMNLQGGGAASVIDTRVGCVHPSLGGVWDEFQATTAGITGAVLTIEGQHSRPPITHGVGEGDCSTMTITEPASVMSAALQTSVPADVAAGTLAAPVSINESGWTWTFSP